MDKCSKEAEISLLLTKMGEIYPVIMGNGKEGLKTSVAKLADRLADMQKHDEEDLQVRKELTTALNGLLRFQTEIETERQVRGEIKKNRKVSVRWLIALIITNIIAIGGILVAILV